jgi:hypothetical protein
MPTQIFEDEKFASQKYKKGVEMRRITSSRCSQITIHPGLSGVLHHTVKLRNYTPGYIAERACREEL